MHGISMASARISKMHTHESRSERALRTHVLESGFLRGSRSKTPLFSRFKMRFKSPIWNNFAFTWAKIWLSNQERAESRSEMSLELILAHVNTAIASVGWQTLAKLKFFNRAGKKLYFGTVAILPYFGKRKQVTKVTFLVKEHINVSVTSIDNNGISWCLT